MAQSVRVSRDLLVEAMQSKGVRAGLAAKAGQIQSRAAGISTSEGVDMDVTVESGTRPKGRPFSNVVGDNAAQEYGDSKTARHRILGRAAESS